MISIFRFAFQYGSSKWLKFTMTTLMMGLLISLEFFVVYNSDFTRIFLWFLSLSL